MSDAASAHPEVPRGPADDVPRGAAELFVGCLERERVEYVFGIPGEETLDLSEALDHSSSITFVPVRHEQSAAFMADAYGRLTGRPGVCLATLGPGATNLATGIGDAFIDKAPLVALARSFGLEGVHVRRAGELPQVLATALRAPGPVLVDIPIDYAETEKLGVDLWKLAPEALI